MRAFLKNKRLVLLLAVLSLGALTMLATSLNSVPFLEGQRYAREEVEMPSFAPAQAPLVTVEIPLWRQLLLLGSLVVLIILFGLLLSPKVNALIGFAHRYGKVFNGTQSRFGPGSLPSAELRFRNQAKGNHQKHNGYHDPPDDPLRKRMVEQTHIPCDVCNRDNDGFVNGFTERKRKQCRNDQYTRQDEPTPQGSHTGSPQ